MISVAKPQSLGKILKAGLLAASLLLLWGCGERASYAKFEGETMGTRYHITAKLPPNVVAVDIHQQFKQRLEEINRSMSTWRDDSLISLFNQSEVGSVIPVDNDFLKVLDISREVYKASNGAFNPGVGRLIDLWGFGRYLTVDQLQNPPSQAAIDEAMARIRFDLIENRDRELIKNSDIHLNFSAVAKGYAVDQLANVLVDAGVKDYMVEIGGEIATSGISPRGTHWRIGIEMPEHVRGRALKAIQVKKAAIATSGDYRNFIDINGKRYSHTIDPRTGSPMENNLASVTVIAENVALADAWATALTVVGAEEALKIAEQNKLAVFLITRKDNEFVSSYSTAMLAYLN